MTRGRWIVSGAGVVVLALAAGAATLIWQKELPPISPPAADRFEREVVKRGEALAQLGGCIACHTAPHGKALAGGRRLQTPFGMVMSDNLTPEPSSGLGAWSLAAFVRAMREGVSRDGQFLYPAFPYDHFTNASDADLAALYAYLMSRAPVAAQEPIDRLDWPFAHRRLLAAWNLLFLDKGPIDDYGGADRGRALAEGLAHCGSCHTPRNRWGAERSDRAYDGAWVEGWYAPALNTHSPAARPWTEEDLFTYLRTGLSAAHAAAVGPMAEVTRGLAAAPEGDVRAIAGYFARRMAAARTADNQAPAFDDRRKEAGQAYPEGAALFGGACSSCHEAGAPMLLQGRPSLALSTALRVETPHNALHVIVRGLATPAGHAGLDMPAFRADFTDRQLAEIAQYLRARYTALPPWRDPEQAAAQVRREVDEQGVEAP